MAVEYQAKKHLFAPSVVPQPTSELFKIDFTKPPANDATAFFTYNYYHDVESVYWMYLWWLHHYIPAVIDTQAPSIAQSLTLMQVQAGELFNPFSTISPCSPERLSLLMTGNADFVLQRLLPVYEPCLPVLLGTYFVGDLKEAYTNLEACTPQETTQGTQVIRRWKETDFHDDLYTAFWDKMEESLRRLNNLHSHAVKPLRDVRPGSPPPNRNLSRKRVHASSVPLGDEHQDKKHRTANEGRTSSTG